MLHAERKRAHAGSGGALRAPSRTVYSCCFNLAVLGTAPPFCGGGSACARARALHSSLHPRHGDDGVHVLIIPGMS